MGGKVTALGLDVITEKSGHVIAPIAPSVCTTPAAPSPGPTTTARMMTMLDVSSRDALASGRLLTRGSGPEDDDA
jgi:hypothetical protein